MRNIDKTFSPQALGRVLIERLKLPANARLKVAYSGGVDSHVLLHALARLRATTGFALAAVHVDHGLQPRSREWSGHCVRIGADLGVPCAVERIEVGTGAGEGLEAAARRERYAALARHVGTDEVLLTAHHLDDQAETVLLQLLRGAGVHGLSAMPELAPFGAGLHARPLLGFTRAQLAAYARAEGLHWIEDLSNFDTRHGRNLIRTRVLPVLKERWPQAAQQLARTARHAAEAAALLDELAQADLDACHHGAALWIPALLRLPAGRRRNALRRWIRARGFRAPSAATLERILAQTQAAPRTRHAAIRWPEAQVRRYRDALLLLPAGGRPDPGLRRAWDGKAPLEIPELGLRLRLVEAIGSGLARARLGPAALTVRLRRGGEACRLPGRAHRHRLKKLLQAAGVPPWERERLPLLYVGDELAAVGDLWVCEPFAARADEPGWRVVVEKIAREMQG